MSDELGIKRVVADHAARYPLMQVSDAVKLVYQNEFGGGHLVGDENASLKLIADELQTANGQAGENAVFIGNGLVRIHLAHAKRIGLSAQTLNRLFVLGAQTVRGSAASFEEKLCALRSLCAEGALPFALHELDAYLDVYRAQGSPAVSHSDVYRAAYHPSYRIIREQDAVFVPLFAAIDKVLAEIPTVCVAIDGRCASGKSTLSALVASVYDANVIRMDDFFVPPALRTPNRYTEPGGNVHYERFLAEVIPNLSQGLPFSHRIFDCQKMDYHGQRQFGQRPVWVVEGSYCLRPEFRSVYDIKVFLDIDDERQAQRLILREGAEGFVPFRDRWIPLEDAYFAACGIREIADLCFSC